MVDRLAVHRQAAALADVVELAHTKAELRRDGVARIDAHADEDVHATELWVERVCDGRIASYLQAVTGR